ncbi:TrkH family potassium uptake protein [Thermosulfurimonas marina]|nr:TrkH family potassium uptake protein [Thermosulfurimonas marina]
MRPLVRPPLRSTLYLAFSFAAAAAVGALFLWLPWMHRGKLSFLDALFTATSAVCVTGLTVVNTATTFTFGGKVVILTLIQLGGLGIMTFSTLFFVLMGRTVPVGESLTLKESFAPYPGVDLKPLLLTIVAYTLFTEALVTLLLWPAFGEGFSPEGFFHALFHAISAFCNAGFSDLPQGLSPYKEAFYLPAVIALAILAGNTGFPIVFEVFHRLVLRQRRRWSLHTRLTLTVHGGLILLGALLFLIFEGNRAFSGLSLPQKLLNAFFLSISSRTAGFSLVDLSRFGEVSLYVLIFLMFIGACPGSTGGGIKTTTFGVLASSVISRLRGYPQPTVFRRTIPQDLVFKALTLAALYAFTIYISQFLLILGAPSRAFAASGTEFLARLFESVSALGTVGLSTGITPQLSPWAKGVIIGTMYVGRVGVLSLAILLTGLSSRPKEFYYPKEEVLLG